jgi:AraC family transcriptional regulator
MDKDNKTLENYTIRVIKAQIYIEKNLEAPLSLDKVSKIAGFSPYHFHRVFHAVTGESLNIYVRRLRIERAAGRLSKGKEAITKIALDSGYGTPSSFGRAFLKEMGISPKQFQEEYMSKYLSTNYHRLKGEKNMLKPKITQMDDITVFFKRELGPYNTSSEKAWKELFTFIKEHKGQLMNARKFGLSLDNPNVTEQENLRFDACVEAKDLPKQKLVEQQILPGGSFAVFEHLGSYETLDETFDSIFKDWYPSHMDKVADTPCFCEYMNMEKMRSHPDELITKIYVPLR